MAARRSHELSRLFARSSQPIFALDDDRRIVFFNEAAVVWTGYSAEEMLATESKYHSALETTGPQRVACALCPPPEVMSGESRASAAVAFLSRDEQPLQAEVLFVPLRGDNGGVIGVLGLISPKSGAISEAAEDVANAASAKLLHARIQRLRQQYRQRYQIDQLLGETPAIVRARAQAAVAAESSASVLIVGPIGSGQEYLARAIHYSQPGPGDEPLVPLACPLVGSELLSSTVVALAQGAAPAASRRVTLLLNDVDRLPASLQATLPALLKSASEKVRVISTSGRSLVELASQGSFDRALAHSLSTLCIELPPLSERLADLPLLAQLFLEQCNARGGKQVGSFTEEALDLLAGYPWHGNLDELDRLVREAHDRAAGVEIAAGDLPQVVYYAASAAAQPRRVEETIVLEEFLAAIERELIERALTEAKGNKTKAAQLLGMTRAKLYRRLVQLGLIEAGPAEPTEGDPAAAETAPMDAFDEDDGMFVAE